ncbi:TetR/AcrR family transcriptional regulator [Streptomyces xiaopingdaonensis]|uniref:TetR/AcrR family transcriptional regulator n=1 Tax=Streptomyces xiaopingdaonensis TaxID=1565415 RepID=UPI00036E16D6|nr:TetR/AcrR family transcriptional regulator [Streptomyces xiaopingdaonensis]
MKTVQGDTRESILTAARQILSRKGFAAVGINEILTAAGVPKGSFYHFFGSKDAFGEAVLRAYYTDYLAEMDRILAEPGLTSAQRLMNYWQYWRETQSADECQGKCLTVKLSAEVSDLSEAMRLALKEGTFAMLDRLERTLTAGLEDGSLAIDGTARDTAQTLYDMWLGASLLVKINRDDAPFDTTMTATRQVLHL